jgi:1,4-alpha-glucan branching enzyme
MGYTHVELLPITEHPYYPSWGYLSVGFFAPTSRYGSPQEFMYLVDKLHQAGVGVLLDWVPAHFPSDTTYLADFDGSNVYEHPNPQKGYHPDWNSLIFNFERPEIRSFLISSAFFWLDRYHIDGLRVDAVASMLYLDYSRKEGEWTPNEYGNNENLSAISFLKDLNKAVYAEFDGITMMAEESTAFSGITRPVYENGLGFGFKWMMGWMNDTLRYMEREPIYRQFHHNEISFSMTYAYSESYILPLSHDEVVHGKQSLIYKMPGDEWQKFANLRTLYAYMFTHPGHKLLFMGNDFAQTSEWNVNQSLQWELLQFAPHQGIKTLIKDLNTLLKKSPALYEHSFSPEGFEWIDFSDNKNSVIAYLRIATNETLLVVCNFTPAAHHLYELGVPAEGVWKEILNTDDKEYGGSGFSELKSTTTTPKKMHGKDFSLTLSLSPLSTCVWQHQVKPSKKKKSKTKTTSRDKAK